MQQDITSRNEDMNYGGNPSKHQVSTAPPSDEALQDPISLAQDEGNEVSFIFTFSFSMIPCSMIQRMKEKWNPWTKLDIPCCTFED